MKLLILILVLCCTVTALDYSHRIQALGKDFANLIPDYETDLYRNPYLLEHRLAGLSFEPILFYRYGTSIYQYVVVNQMPVTLRLMTENMGMAGQYWINYAHGLEPHDYGWRSSTFNALRISDLWMYRVRKVVINLYNDLDYSKITYLTSTNSESIEKRLEYIAKTQISLQLRKRLSLDLKLGYGLCENTEEVEQIDVRKQHVNLGLLRIGLYCRNISSVNDFLVWYFDVGSPITNAELDSLPYSIYSHLAENETKFTMFAQTLTARFGIAKALPIASRGFVAIGLKNTYLRQDTEDQIRLTSLIGAENTLSLPIAIEYKVSNVKLRFGTRFHYDFLSLHESRLGISEQRIEHEFGYEYSLGIGWQLHRNLALDLYNNGDLTYLRNWALYIKYIF